MEQVKVDWASALIWWPYLSYYMYQYWFYLHQTWMMHLVILMQSTDFDAKYEPIGFGYWRTNWFWVLEDIKVLEQLCWSFWSKCPLMVISKLLLNLSMDDTSCDTNALDRFGQRFQVFGAGHISREKLILILIQTYMQLRMCLIWSW